MRQKFSKAQNQIYIITLSLFFLAFIFLLKEVKMDWIHKLFIHITVFSFFSIYFFYMKKEKKRILKQLMKLETAVESVKSTIVITDANGNIEYANPYFTDLTGYTLNECIGKNVRIFNSGYHKKEYYEELWNTIHSGKSWEGEFFNQKKNGEYYWENATISPIRNEKNEITNFVAVKTDITEKKETELELNKHRNHLEYLVTERTNELLEANKIAEEANATKDKFFSIIGHDLSNLFGSFLNIMEMWRYYKNGVPEDQFVKILNSVQNSAEMGYTLLLNLLEWSRLQTGRIPFKQERIHLKQMVEETFRLLESNAMKKNIEMSLNIPEDITIFADINMLDTTIRNLVSNAIKFTPNGGEISVSSERKDSFIEIAVKDSGVGIEPENLQKIFQIDTKHKTFGTNKERGTGLGLILCKEFVEKHKGEINVNSTPNEGSQFFIRLPLLSC